MRICFPVGRRLVPPHFDLLDSAQHRQRDAGHSACLHSAATPSILIPAAAPVATPSILIPAAANAVATTIQVRAALPEAGHLCWQQVLQLECVRGLPGVLPAAATVATCPTPTAAEPIATTEPKTNRRQSGQRDLHLGLPNSPGGLTARKKYLASHDLGL